MAQDSGTIAGPVIAGVIADRFGFGPAFWLTAALSAVVALIWGSPARPGDVHHCPHRLHNLTSRVVRPTRFRRSRLDRCGFAETGWGWRAGGRHCHSRLTQRLGVALREHLLHRRLLGGLRLVHLLGECPDVFRRAVGGSITIDIM